MSVDDDRPIHRTPEVVAHADAERAEHTKQNKFHPREELQVYWPMSVTEMNAFKLSQRWWQDHIVKHAGGKGCYVRLSTRNWLRRTFHGWGKYSLLICGPEKT